MTTTVNNRVYLSFYLWLLSFHYSIRTLYFLREAFFETDFPILDHRDSGVYGFKFFCISENTEVFEDLHKDFGKILNIFFSFLLPTSK